MVKVQKKIPVVVYYIKKEWRHFIYYLIEMLIIYLADLILKFFKFILNNKKKSQNKKKWI